MPEFEDKEIDCAGCKKTFTWTAGEQAYYEEKVFTPPKRCKPCRRAKKEARENQ